MIGMLRSVSPDDPKWQLEARTGQADVFLPRDFDLTDYIEVTTFGDTFAVFANTRTGNIIRCADFYR